MLCYLRTQTGQRFQSATDSCDILLWAACHVRAHAEQPFSFRANSRMPSPTQIRNDAFSPDMASADALSSRSRIASPRTHLPHGVADYFWAEARERRELEAALLKLFRTWGYADVIPPMFEYAATYQARAGTELESETYYFLDRDGSTLALRADMTIPVARLVATRLHDWPMPQRFCYAGSVFRYTEPQAGMQREFAQAGVELIGSYNPRADAEVLALAARGLHAAGIDQFKLAIGQIGFFNGLLAELDLAPHLAGSLQAAIERNSDADLLDFLRTASLQPSERRTVEGLPSLNGPDVIEVLRQAERFCLNPAMRASVTNLAAVCDHLDAYGEADHLFADLTEIHNLGYYTGITFEALTLELGFPVASGGRYDNLVGTFGANQPAVGVAFASERLLLAHRRSRTGAPWARTAASTGAERAVRPVAPTVLLATGDHAASMSVVNLWRSMGLSVALDVDAHAPESFAALARSMGAQFFAQWIEDALHIVPADKPDAVPHVFSAENAGQFAVEILHAASDR